MLSWVPDLWGRKYQKLEVCSAHAFVEAGSITCKTNAHYFMVTLSALPERTRALNSDQLITRPSPVGSFEVFPQNSELFSAWPIAKEAMLVGFTPQKLARLAQLELDNDLSELHQPPIGNVDRGSLLLCQQIKHEMLNDNIGRAESLESLITLLGVHVLRKYTNLVEKTVKHHGGGLSPKSWNKVHEYINENVGGNLSIENLAERAFLSPSHFLRAFRQTTGQTPHQYVVRVRLAEARRLILKTNMSLEEISKVCGFASGSHLTISIKKMWGLTPTQLRKNS